MPRDRFENTAKERILEYLQNAGCDDIGINDIVTVWFCYMIGNMKGLFAIPCSGCYFEATYHRERNSIYLDCYEKTEHRTVYLEA